MCAEGTRRGTTEIGGRRSPFSTSGLGLLGEPQDFSKGEHAIDRGSKAWSWRYAEEGAHNPDSLEPELTLLRIPREVEGILSAGGAVVVGRAVDLDQVPVVVVVGGQRPRVRHHVHGDVVAGDGLRRFRAVRPVVGEDTFDVHLEVAFVHHEGDLVEHAVRAAGVGAAGVGVLGGTVHGVVAAGDEEGQGEDAEHHDCT